MLYAGSVRRLSSLLTAVFGTHSRPVLNRAFQRSLRVTIEILCLFPAGCWRCCAAGLWAKNQCVSRVLAYVARPASLLFAVYPLKARGTWRAQ